MSALTKFLKKKGDAQGIKAGGQSEVSDETMGSGKSSLAAMLRGEEAPGSATGALKNDAGKTVSMDDAKLKKLLHGIDCY